MSLQPAFRIMPHCEQWAGVLSLRHPSDRHSSHRGHVVEHVHVESVCRHKHGATHVAYLVLHSHPGPRVRKLMACKEMLAKPPTLLSNKEQPFLSEQPKQYLVHDALFLFLGTQRWQPLHKLRSIHAWSFQMFYRSVLQNVESMYPITHQSRFCAACRASPTMSVCFLVDGSTRCFLIRHLRFG